MDSFALKETFLALQALQVACCFLKKSFLIFLLSYMVCCFVYVLGGMMCIKDTVLNRSVYNKYLFEAVHFL